MVVVGASDTISVVIRQTMVQLRTPDQMRGRVYAVNSMVTNTSNQLGIFRAGTAAAVFGTVPSVLIGGLSTIAVVLISTKIFRELYDADRYHDARAVMPSNGPGSGGAAAASWRRPIWPGGKGTPYATAHDRSACASLADCRDRGAGARRGALRRRFRRLAARRQTGSRGATASRSAPSNRRLAGVTYDPTIIARDHAQGVFRQSFEQFSGRMVPPRLARARQKLLQQYGALLSRIEQQFGVPGAVIVAIWGLETDFGADNGHFPTIRSLATLAYDCRRPDKFRGELIAALRIVDRGDMTPADMRGAWAGEIGQTQFLPSSYLKYAVDYDGNGRRDLIHSVPDVLASTANYLKGYGWQRGQPWGEGTANFQVLLQWNASQVYTKTVAYFAQQLAGGDDAQYALSRSILALARMSRLARIAARLRAMRSPTCGCSRAEPVEFLRSAIPGTSTSVSAQTSAVRRSSSSVISPNSMP